MTVDYQTNEIHISAEEWVTVLLPDSTEITIKGDGTGFTDSGQELRFSLVAGRLTGIT